MDATTDNNIAVVQTMIEEDSRVTVAQLEEAIGISSGSIRTILHEKLFLNKISARWVPHRLTRIVEKHGVCELASSLGVREVRHILQINPTLVNSRYGSQYSDEKIAVYQAYSDKWYAILGEAWK